ncbi:MAG: hypothetical protein JWP44_5036 [Mucilaginibacter sp.]|nr:hypothetical protein [Mucilaginibacter sp.]
MKLPTSNTGRFFFYFSMQFILYGLAVANGRAYVQASYLWTAITDILMATQSFFILRRVAKDSDDDLHGPSLIGYITGGVCGSMVAIYVTKIIYGQ